MYNRIIVDEEIGLTNAIGAAIKIGRIKPPYKIDRRIDGTVVIFSEHFIDAYRIALSRNCIANMNEKEKDLYFGFIKYQQEQDSFNILESKDLEDVYSALVNWTTDELMGNPHPEYEVCD